MHAPDLTLAEFADPAVREAVRAGDMARATFSAQARLAESMRCAGDMTDMSALPSHHATAIAEALADLAGVMNASGAGFDQPAALLDRAIGLAPNSEHVFRTLAVLLYTNRRMHGANFQTLAQVLLADGAAAWRDRYRALLLMPTFLNLEFVSGKCNLKCRMCVGTNSAGHPNKLTYMNAEKFGAMLDAAPGVRALTLSSGDSDPLLHPQLARVLAIAGERGVLLDIYTNALPMGDRIRRAIVESGAVSMLNVSIDAATPESYTRIRGGDLARVHENIRAMQALKAEVGAHLPQLSLSFVAMADNVDELPLFVEQARDFGARRVFVGDLIGWRGEDGRGDGGNVSAMENPRWKTSIEEAVRIGASAGIHIELPERFAHARPNPAQTDAAPVESARHRACGWMNGVWVNRDGSLDPCCLVHGVADMGSAADAPLLQNPKYLRVKSLLAEGKVFEACRGQRMCPYVQQQEAAGTALRVITDKELGELAPAAAGGTPQVRISLPVLNAA